MDSSNKILILNAGSSSFKAALYRVDGEVTKLVDRTQFDQQTTKNFNFNDLVDWLVGLDSAKDITAIGHRLVHGGTKYSDSVRINGAVVAELRQLVELDPEHTPAAIQLIGACAHTFHGTPQFASFDTAFFANLPKVAQLLPIPRQYQATGLRRYGFHGLSYTYLQSKFRDVAGAEAANGRVIYAHLGSGASLAATLNSQPIDTTMSFTPASGLVMSSRSGDLDPGVIGYLSRQFDMDINAYLEMTNKASGLLGVSGISSDMKALLERETDNPDAAEAVELFCLRSAQAISGLAATIGGLDSLIFSGGIGEQSSIIRRRICDKLQFLGIDIDEQRNKSHAELISSDDSRIGVHVFATDEAAVIVKDVVNRLKEEVRA